MLPMPFRNARFHDFRSPFPHSSAASLPSLSSQASSVTSRASDRGDYSGAEAERAVVGPGESSLFFAFSSDTAQRMEKKQKEARRSSFSRAVGPVPPLVLALGRFRDASGPCPKPPGARSRRTRRGRPCARREQRPLLLLLFSFCLRWARRVTLRRLTSLPRVLSPCFSAPSFGLLLLHARSRRSCASIDVLKTSREGAEEREKRRERERRRRHCPFWFKTAVFFVFRLLSFLAPSHRRHFSLSLLLPTSRWNRLLSRPSSGVEK
jgi:hypothetical protein